VDRPIVEDSGLQRLREIPGAVVLTSRQASFSDEFEPYRIGFLGIEQCREIYEKIRFRDSKRKIGSDEKQDLEYVMDNLAGRHTFHGEVIAILHPYRFAIGELAAKEIMEVYDYEWTDEEI